jgi:hypothetical protein
MSGPSPGNSEFVNVFSKLWPDLTWLGEHVLAGGCILLAFWIAAKLSEYLICMIRNRRPHNSELLQLLGRTTKIAVVIFGVAQRILEEHSVVIDDNISSEAMHERRVARDAVAITRAPRQRASCTAKEPTPPAWISTLCPAASCACSKSPCQAVSAESGSAAACA